MSAPRRSVSVLAGGLLVAGLLSVGGAASATAPGDPIPTCLGEPATIVGTPGADVDLEGTDGPDVIVGLGGDDRISSHKGADIICGGFGDDRLVGGRGDDRIVGGADGSPEGDEIGGQLGDDWLAADGTPTDRVPADRAGGADGLFGSVGDNVLVGGPSDDVLFGGSGRDLAHGRSGDDLIEGFEGRDLLFGQAGDDTLDPDDRKSDENDRADGGPGTDTISYLFSTTGGVEIDLADEVAVGAGQDTILGFENATGSGENDIVRGDAGDNLLLGNHGNDVLIGRAGDDTADGEQGTDTCEAETVRHCEA